MPAAALCGHAQQDRLQRDTVYSPEAPKSAGCSQLLLLNVQQPAPGPAEAWGFQEMTL